MNSEVALRRFRWLAQFILVYSMGVMFFALSTLLVQLDKPYGGFIWSWDNSFGMYRVDNFSIIREGKLQTADLILAVEDQTGSSQETVRQARWSYSGAQQVCFDGTSSTTSLVHYQVWRSAEKLSTSAPIQCFRFPNLLRLATFPLSMALLIWLIGFFVYRANPDDELNLIFAISSGWIANIVGMQAAITPDIDTQAGQLVALLITNPSPIFMTASLYHLIAVLPPEHRSGNLYRTRFWWYLFIPLLLLIAGAIRFQLAVHWNVYVGMADRAAGAATVVYMYTVVMVTLVRYISIYRTTCSLRAKQQVKLFAIFSLIAGLGLLPLILAQRLTWLTAWVPINQPAFLFTLLLVFIGIAYTILRYQIFIRRTQSLTFLLALAIAVITGVTFSFIPLLSVEVGFIIMFVLLIGVNLFWTWPNNRFQHSLRRLTSPGSIERKTIEAFNLKIGGNYDLEALPGDLLRYLEKDLELHFAALWLRNHEILELAGVTEQAPIDSTPEFLEAQRYQFERPENIQDGSLSKIGYEIGLPLIFHGNSLGLIGISQRWTGEVFDQTDLAALKVMTDQAALTLGTAQQIRELRLLPLKVEEAQMNERDRIARDLHDSALNRLTQLLFALETLRQPIRSDTAQAENLLEGIIQTVTQTASEVRDIVNDLMPRRLQGRELQRALQEYISSTKYTYSDVQFKYNIEAVIENLLSPTQKADMFWVCRQAVDNALIHARANLITITLQSSKDHNVVEFSIIDNGRGFIKRSQEEVRSNNHFGLLFMETRLLQHGGRLAVESTPGQGTVVKGYMPAKKP